MTTTHGLDAHQPPPPSIKEIFKLFQKKQQIAQVDVDENIIDFSRKDVEAQHHLTLHREIPSNLLADVYSSLLGADIQVETKQVYSHAVLPGLLLIPSLVSESVQRNLLSRLIHRHLSDERHKTNVHMHYDVLYPESPAAGASDDYCKSFFSLPSSLSFQPKDPSMHKPLPVSKFLNKSLRWVTLGGQYDWTNKVYEENPPGFPGDISDFVGRLFPEMKPEAAIVNFYSPGDTLSLHRDVSEHVDNGLVSLSIGCDCLFVIGLHDSKDTLVIRLRSGDAVYMSGEARFAWHGVPKILANTCPEDLADWPADLSNCQFEEWRGWLRNKRINLNVRQMF